MIGGTIASRNLMVDGRMIIERNFDTILEFGLNTQFQFYKIGL
jgi:hypothetical protein